MPIKTKPFDAAKYFGTDEAQIDLVTDALKTGDAGYIAAAIGTIAKARGMTEVAREAGLSRQALHKTLADDGNPTLGTVMKVLGVLGLRLEAKAREPEMA